MFARALNSTAGKVLQHGANRQQNILLVAKRSVHKQFYFGAPPMRHMTVWHHIGLFLFIAVSTLAYPTYMLLNIDNIRPRPTAQFSDELNEQLAERRRLRAEGKLNVLQKKLEG